MDTRFEEFGSTTYVTVGGAGEQTKTLKAAPGKAYTIDVVNVAGADRFLWVVDDITDASTALLIPPLKIPAGGFVSIQWQAALKFATGMTVSSSSTQATYTAGGADLMMRVVFK
jgi:hypothetical protein